LLVLTDSLLKYTTDFICFQARKFAPGSSPLFSDTDSDHGSDEPIVISSSFSTYVPNLAGSRCSSSSDRDSNVTTYSKSDYPLLFGKKVCYLNILSVRSTTKNIINKYGNIKYFLGKILIYKLKT
jgi:hypothetical protein